MDDKLIRIRELINTKEATDAELAELVGEAPQQPPVEASKAKRGRPPKPTAQVTETGPAMEKANGQGHTGTLETATELGPTD